MIKKEMLGGLSPSRFLREYWQKKPLLIRKAFPEFKGFLNKNELITLSCREDVQSRFVQYDQNRWTLLNGPFKKRHFTKLTGNWTLLVQDVNHFISEAHALMMAFNFIPYARLDDVMVSFAPDGGGVGPHVDSYDVFLLQGLGKRLWQISKQKDQSLLDAPLRVLKNFKPEEEWVLEPGDMLYLPPHYAHNGIAVGECMTYSIGFRAPSYAELVREFLIYLENHFEIEGHYSDPQLKATTSPASISNEMIDKIMCVLKKIQFGKNEVEDFLGRYLSEPKSTVFFETPELLLDKINFFEAAKQNEIALDLKSQLFYTENFFFMNGEVFSFPLDIKSQIQKLANERNCLVTPEMIESAGDVIYEWYLEGYVKLDFKK